MTAVMGMKQVVVYSTAKTSIIGLRGSMVSQLAVDNIRINTIAPGCIESPMLYKTINQHGVIELFYRYAYRLEKLYIIP